MKSEILQIRPMMPHVEAALNESFVVHRYWEAADSKTLLGDVGPRVRAIATDGHAGLSPETMAALPSLEIIASYGVGYDAIDVSACQARGVHVTNTPDVLNDAVAELTLGLMVSLSRRIPQADRHIRDEKWLEQSYP